MAEVVMIDGQQLDPTSFGEFDEDSGIWKPINVSGLTFGTNGFYLDFEDSSALGNDVSGNNNDFTVNNLTSIDQTTDTCTNNYATWNSLVPLGTFSEGNTVWTSVASGDGAAFSNIGVDSGKWYMECKITTSNASGWGIGVAPALNLHGVTAGIGTSDVGGVGYTGDGIIRRAGTTVASGLTTFAQNDIIGVALDMDSRKVYFYKNGSALYSGTGVDLPSTTGFYVFGIVIGIQVFQHNGKLRQPSILNLYGNFEYSVPSGYYALNTKNLEYG